MTQTPDISYGYRANPDGTFTVTMHDEKAWAQGSDGGYTNTVATLQYGFREEAKAEEFCQLSNAVEEAQMGLDRLLREMEAPEPARSKDVRDLDQILADTPRTDEAMLEYGLFMALIAPSDEMAQEFGKRADILAARLDEGTIERAKERAIQRADEWKANHLTPSDYVETTA